MSDPNEVGRNAVYRNVNGSNIVTELLSDRQLKIKGHELSCCCPFHDEKKPSFGINLYTGRYNCFSCGAKGNIVKFVSTMLNISRAEAIEKIREDGSFEVPSQYYYTAEDYAEEKGLNINTLIHLGVKTREDGKCVEIPYFDIDGEFVFNRYRNNPNNSKFPKFHCEKGTKLIPYGLQFLNNFNDDYIILVEGESDYHAMMEQEMKVIGIPGAENFKEEFVPYFKNFKKIYIHNEEDEAGHKFVDTISRMLPNEEIYEISSRRVNIDCKDPSDLHLKRILNLEELLATAKKVEKKAAVPVEAKKDTYKKNNKSFEADDKLAEHVEISNRIIQQRYMHFFNGSHYVYENGVYKRNKELIEKMILQINLNASEHLRREILENIRIRTHIEEKEINDRYINFKNGLFDIEQEKLIEHTPDYFSTAQVNANYIEDDKLVVNPYIEKFLNDITSGNLERRKALLQMSGYTLTVRTDWQLSFILYGETSGNAKSTFLGMLTKMLGSKNVSHVSMHRLSERFQSVRLVDKFANIATEIERNSIEKNETFKALVTGDEQEFEPKHKESFSAIPFCKLIWGSNYLPEFKEADESIYRRLYIIKFDRKFTDEEREKFDESKILTQEALDYFSNISLREFLKVKINRNLAYREESNRLLEQCKQSNDSIERFLGNEDLIKDMYSTTNKVPKTVIYARYVGYCKENKFFIKKKQDFYNEILMKENYRECSKDGYDCIENMSIKKDGAKEKLETF